jgi:hypothetical protein
MRGYDAVQWPKDDAALARGHSQRPGRSSSRTGSFAAGFFVARTAHLVCIETRAPFFRCTENG